MHICFLTPEYPTSAKPEGGLGNYIQKTSLELLDRGCSVSIFILSTHAGHEVAGKIRLNYVPEFLFPWRIRRLPVLRPLIFLIEHRIITGRIKRAVLTENQKNQIDILQVPNYKALGLGLCNIKSFPVVCRCSSYQPLMRTANQQKRDLVEALYEHLEEKQLRKADAVFAPSELIAHVVSDILGHQPVVIRTPLDMGSINYDLLTYKKLLEGKKFLLFFGVLNGVKGVDILIDAAGELLSQYKDLNIVFIGRNDKIRSHLKSVDYMRMKLGEYMRCGRVQYFPPIQKSELYPVIQSAFGVVLPSRVDNYPNTCLEALSLNVPIVGTYHSSIDEIIEDGKTGFLAENGDPEKLRVSIRRLLEQTPQERLKMIKNIQEKINEIKNEDRIGTLIHFYEVVIQRYSKKD